MLRFYFLWTAVISAVCFVEGAYFLMLVNAFCGVYISVVIAKEKKIKKFLGG